MDGRLRWFDSLAKLAMVAVSCLAALVPRARADDTPDPDRVVGVPAGVLEDEVRGGMLGQVLGNLNGLPHEMKYVGRPGRVWRYEPSLPDGARTDDDTDIEWVYACEIQRSGVLLAPPARQRELWRRHINRGIWCANAYARHLMDLGIEPPLTGRLAVNPWSNFNIGGSFLTETWGPASPGMPQAGGRIGLHYTHVGIDAAPAQCTQFVTAMIATAYFEPDPDKIVAAGLAAVDKRSKLNEVIGDVRQWARENPDDWKAARTKIRDKYTHFGGEAMPDKNGYELNTAADVAALLYGKGDFTESIRHAFNFGWDADCNAAAVGAVVGVLKGRRWMDEQHWNVKDVYRNTVRDDMPNDETITKFGDRVIDVARRVVAENGGQIVTEGGKTVYRIRLQPPANVEPLPEPADRLPDLRKELLPAIERDLAGPAATDRARAAYLAICLDEAPRLMKDRPDEWAKAVADLQMAATTKDIFEAPVPDGPKLQQKVKAAGLRPPPPPAPATGPATSPAK